MITEQRKLQLDAVAYRLTKTQKDFMSYFRNEYPDHEMVEEINYVLSRYYKRSKHA